MQKIYAFSSEHYPGWIKVGMTSRNVERRVREIYQTTIPYGELPYKILWSEDAIADNGRQFKDFDVHYMLCAMGVLRGYGEWFECSLDDVKQAIANVKHGVDASELVKLNYSDQV